MPDLIKIADWAEQMGFSRQSGYDAVKRCNIPVQDGKVDAAVATLLYNQRTRQRANGQRQDGPDALGGSAAGGGAGVGAGKVPGYDSSRARREAAEAEAAELRLAEMAGKFLLKADVDATVFAVARSLRDGLTNCAQRIAADVAALSSAEECEVVIEREHRALLADLSQTLTDRLQLQPLEDDSVCS